MKLSIITINRNNAAGLEKTLKSVAAQSCKDFEHIIESINQVFVELKQKWYGG